MTAIFSENWYRVRDLKPKLRQHAQIYRHEYRQQVWYLLQDETTGQFHRFTPQAWRVIGLLNGKLSVEQIWLQVSEQLGDDMPSQDEVIELLAKLHRANVLHAGDCPDLALLTQQQTKKQLQKRFKQWNSPFSIKVPLLNPHSFISRTAWLARGVFNPICGLTILLLWLFSALGLAEQSQVLTENLADKLLQPSGILMMLLVYPFIKLIHEFAHGYAVKRFGGSVNEMGILFLVLFPVPYIDASSSISFSNKYHRMLVAASGIIAELTLAALAGIVWLTVEPSHTRSVAYFVMMTAGLSSLLFNGNPLLKFDAYYVLSDWLELPNLAQRANKYVGYIFKRYGLWLKHEQDPEALQSGKLWLFCYGIAAFVYRMLIFVAIALFVAQEYLFAGVVLLVWSTTTTMFIPLFRTLINMAKTHSAPHLRGKALRASALFLSSLILLLFVVPMPMTTTIQGVTWVPEKNRIVSHSAGLVTDIIEPSQKNVTQHQALMFLQSEQLSKDIQVTSAQIAELEARLVDVARDSVQLQIVQSELAGLQKVLARQLQRQQDLVVKASQSGQLVWLPEQSLLGAYVQRGQLLGYILPSHFDTLKASVSEDDIDLIKLNEYLDVRFSSNMANNHRAKITVVTPQAHQTLLSPVLAGQSGGEIELLPDKKSSSEHDTSGLPQTQKMQSLDHFFTISLTLEQPVPATIDERVYVKITHPAEPIIYRWYRDIRRLLLRRFDL
ncbi:peptidase M50 [Saccharobesus litoralis]|uniref:Peptidase M50 n=2 Tax=Saccharobesus litoralis TaxID=2172099 RepID=A0A2S0VSS5_9ALTE|nr:peptidase M50 [Saccharobesus litoralis]